jgi:hypothetical protein
MPASDTHARRRSTSDLGASFCFCQCVSEGRLAWAEIDSGRVEREDIEGGLEGGSSRKARGENMQDSPKKEIEQRRAGRRQ